MNEQHSNWQSQELAQIFSEGVRGAVPGTNLQKEIISKIVREWCPLPTKILDLGCGDGILGRMLLNEYADVHVTFADFSEPMLEKLRTKIGVNERAMVVNMDFGKSTWTREVESA